MSRTIFTEKDMLELVREMHKEIPETAFVSLRWDHLSDPRKRKYELWVEWMHPEGATVQDPK